MTSQRSFVTCLTLLTLIAPATANDFAHGARPFEDCLTASVTKKPGRVIKVEFKTVGDRKAYEFDIQGSDAISWDVECNADTAAIVSIEHEVDSPADPLFSARASISESQARQTVATRFPGSVEEIEYEVEEDGAASFEFDVLGQDGMQTKVEVDASSGRIIEVDHELWQVGFE